MSNRTRKRRWREELKNSRGSIRPPWPAFWIGANVPIDDHAFVPADTYQPRGHELVVATQHASHTNVEPSVDVLISAVRKRAKAKGFKPYPPDPRWLDPTAPTPPDLPAVTTNYGYILPAPTRKYERVNWDNFKPSTILGMVICRKCGTHISDELLVEQPHRQHCPHKLWG